MNTSIPKIDLQCHIACGESRGLGVVIFIIYTGVEGFIDSFPSDPLGA